MSNIVTNVGGQSGSVALLYAYDYGAFNTGADVSYATGDDKWVRDNVYNPEIATWDTSLIWVYPTLDPTDTTKLLRGSNPDGSGNNIFGNLERFTDDLGTQVYANSIKIDHFTGLMWNTINTSTETWEAGIILVNDSTNYGKTDWHLPNVNQYFLSTRWGLPNSFLGESFNVSSMASTIRAADTNSFLWVRFDQNWIQSRLRSQSSNTRQTRKAFTYNTTTKQMELN